jgi:hypothetical protein
MTTIPTDTFPDMVAEAPIVGPGMTTIPTDTFPDMVAEASLDELPHVPQFADVPERTPLAPAQVSPLAVEPLSSNSAATTDQITQRVPPAMPGAPHGAALSQHVWPTAMPAEPANQRPIQPVHSPGWVAEPAAQVGSSTFAETHGSSTQAPPNTIAPGVTPVYAADPDAHQTRFEHNSESGLDELPEAMSGMPSEQNVREQEETAQTGDLFAPRGTDRSPQAWSARLRGMLPATQLGERASSTSAASQRSVMHRTHAPIVDNQPPPAGVAPDHDVSVDQQIADRLVAADSAREPMSAGSPRAWAARLAQAFPASPPARPQAGAQKAASTPPFIHRPVGTSAPIAAGAQTTESTADHTQAERATVASSGRMIEEPQSAGLPPTTLSDSTRRFLRPLVGIDPAAVNIYRDARANQVAALYAADAITFGDTIWLAAGRGEDTPEDLGLLAHELTHIRRSSDRRFVPPIVREAQAAADLYEDEETLAERVEARVGSVAREHLRADWDVHTQADRSLPAHEVSEETVPSPTMLAQRADQQLGSGSPNSSAWGGLPAPWDPLPAWMATPASVASSPQHMAASSATGTGSPQRAARDRAIPEPSEPEQEADAAPTPELQAPLPDLDALAQQVYDALKQRLAMERRREGLY